MKQIILKPVIKLWLLCGLSVIGLHCVAETSRIVNIEAVHAGQGNVQMFVEFQGPVVMPTFFTMDDPAKLILDFPYVVDGNSEDGQAKLRKIGSVNNYYSISSRKKTRLVIELDKLPEFSLQNKENGVMITLASAAKEKEVSNTLTSAIEAIDFRRGEDGEGKFIVELSNNNIHADFRHSQDEIILEFDQVSIKENLLREFDVRDFNTPIESIVIQQKGLQVTMTIRSYGEFEKSAYQHDNKFVVEVRPMTAQEKALIQAQKFKFTGERISLSFQDIEVQSVLQLLADFTGLNIVASESVAGNLTLRLENIPWDQALDFVLKAKGLGKREVGNVIHVAPSDELTAAEQTALEALQQTESLSPLVEDFVQVNFAKAIDIADILKNEDNILLSNRGQVSVDERTNTLLLRDTEEKLVEIKKLLTRLDVPVRQVMIEAYIVLTKDDFTDVFGIRLTGAGRSQVGRYDLGVAPTTDVARTIADDPSSITAQTSNFFFDFAESAAKGKLGLAIAKLPGGTLLDLELQASEAENKSRTISRPKLMTLDQQTASIESGEELAFVTTSANGGDTTTFKKAVLRLEVTPSITPDNHVSLTFSLSQDTVGESFGSSVAVDTTTMDTLILVKNNETAVLGGIYQVDGSRQRKRIPFFSDLPLVGRLFTSKNNRDLRSEVMIFITPRIIDPSFST